MFHIDLKLLRHRCYDMIRCYGIKIRNLGNHVTDWVWELMKCLEKSLKNTCEGVFFLNVLNLKPADLRNNTLLNRIF